VSEQPMQVPPWSAGPFCDPFFPETNPCPRPSRPRIPLKETAKLPRLECGLEQLNATHTSSGIRTTDHSCAGGCKDPDRTIPLFLDFAGKANQVGWDGAAPHAPLLFLNRPDPGQAKTATNVELPPFFVLFDPATPTLPRARGCAQPGTLGSCSEGRHPARPCACDKPQLRLTGPGRLSLSAYRLVVVDGRLLGRNSAASRSRAWLRNGLGKRGHDWIPESHGVCNRSHRHTDIQTLVPDLSPTVRHRRAPFSVSPHSWGWLQEGHQTDL